MRRNLKLYVILCGLLLGGSSVVMAQTFTFTTIDVPGAFETVPFGINESGQIVGTFQEPSGRHSFLLAGGSFTTIDVPGDSNTEAFGINESGQIVGTFGIHGFLLTGGGFTTIDVPGTSGTKAFGINESGQIVGAFFDASSFESHGFLLTGGGFTTIDVPGAIRTEPFGINESGQIVGTFVDPSFRFHGFLLTEGSFTTIDVPGALFTRGAYGINEKGQIVGDFGGTEVVHGFIATPPTPVPDTDGDGVPDVNDNCPNDANPDQVDNDSDGIGDACDPDDDNDGMSDDFENANSLDPNDPSDASEDPDNDGLTNLQEFQLGTDPHNADTDDDGFTDGAEVDQSSNPLDRADPPPLPPTMDALVGNRTIYLFWTPPIAVTDRFHATIQRRNGNTYESVGMFDFASDSAEINPVIFFLVFPNGVPVSNGTVYRLMVKAEREGTLSEESNAVLAVPGEAAAMEKPVHPLLFLHGFNARGRSTFKATVDFLKHTLGWTDGRHLFHVNENTTTQFSQDFDSNGDFFTVDFGNKSAHYPTLHDIGLPDGYAHQGTEVAVFVRDLKFSGVRFPLALGSF